MFKRLLLALVLCFACAPAWAQNVLCPTRPLNDASNACATTNFVQQSLGGALPIPGVTGPFIAGNPAQAPTSGVGFQTLPQSPNNTSVPWGASFESNNGASSVALIAGALGRPSDGEGGSQTIQQNYVNVSSALKHYDEFVFTIGTNIVKAWSCNEPTCNYLFSGGTSIRTDSNNGFYLIIQTPMPIGNLPACVLGNEGALAVINNGITNPTYHQVVSTTGTASWPVWCIFNGTSFNWVY